MVGGASGTLQLHHRNKKAEKKRKSSEAAREVSAAIAAGSRTNVGKTIVARPASDLN
jgi:hypothetical protein